MTPPTWFLQLPLAQRLRVWRECAVQLALNDARARVVVERTVLPDATVTGGRYSITFHGATAHFTVDENVFTAVFEVAEYLGYGWNAEGLTPAQHDALLRELVRVSTPGPLEPYTLTLEEILALDATPPETVLS